MVSILNRLASSLGRRDEVPNQELARDLAAKKDKAAFVRSQKTFGTKIRISRLIASKSFMKLATWNQN